MYTVNEAKKTNLAKKKFRVCRKLCTIAAVEAKVYGKLAFKETDVTQRNEKGKLVYRVNSRFNG